jgi:hypothetical protein
VSWVQDRTRAHQVYDKLPAEFVEGPSLRATQVITRTEDEGYGTIRAFDPKTDIRKWVSSISIALAVPCWRSDLRRWGAQLTKSAALTESLRTLSPTNVGAAGSERGSDLGRDGSFTNCPF